MKEWNEYIERKEAIKINICTKCIWSNAVKDLHRMECKRKMRRNKCLNVMHKMKCKEIQMQIYLIKWIT